MKKLIIAFITLMTLLPSCSKHDSQPKAILPDDPNDVTIAFFGFQDGKQTIHAGKLHSNNYRRLCIGAYPSVSPSGRFVARNPEGDDRFKSRAIPPIVVTELATGKETSFASIPKGTAPWPGCVWSTDDSLISFDVHDFDGNRSKAVVSLADGSYWRGTEAAHGAKFGRFFSQPLSKISIAIIASEPVPLGFEARTLYYHKPDGSQIRITPATMWVAGKALWIERTGEVVFLALWHSDLNPGTSPKKMAWKHPPNVYLINPSSKDWTKATSRQWEDALIFNAQDVSCSN